jgi:hypothetical protein
MVRGSLVLLAVLLTLSGCFLGSSGGHPADLADADVIGAWRDAKGAVLTFQADGTFAATDMPYQLFTGFSHRMLPEGYDPQRDRLPANGWWKVDWDVGKSSGPRNHVDLNVKLLAGKEVRTGLDLIAQRQDGDIVLFFFIGDPDSNNRVVYHKCADDCPTPAPTTP